LVLTRQNLPQLAGSSPEAVVKGGYVLQDSEGKVILMLTPASAMLSVLVLCYVACVSIPDMILMDIMLMLMIE
jgi:phage terminase large subunit-like protein